MKATPKFDRDLASRVIAEAVAGGDQATCDKHGITLRTLQRWRKRLEGDSLLSQAVADKKAIVEKDWADRLPSAIGACVDWIRDALPNMEPSPESMHSIAGAMKLLVETGLQKQLLDVRLARQAGQAGQANGSPVGSSGNVVALRPAARAPADGLHPGGEQEISGAEASR